MEVINLTPNPGDPEAIGSGGEYIATVPRLLERFPFLGSVTSIRRMMFQDGMPYQRLRGNYLYHVPTLMAWLKNRPGRNLPAA